MTQAEDSRFLEIFPQWLRSLGTDAAGVGDSMGSKVVDDVATRLLIGGLSYVFKSLDLIPDGIEDLGYMDDAFVLRVACHLATSARADVAVGPVARLASDVRAVTDFLGAPDYARLEDYVKGLCRGAARGRTVDEIASDAAARESFLNDVRAWSASYRMPAFTRDPKTLVKLKAFLGAKLA